MSPDTLIFLIDADCPLYSEYSCLGSSPL